MPTAPTPAWSTSRPGKPTSRWRTIRTTSRRPGGFNLGIEFGGINQSATNLKPTSKTGITGRLKAWDPVARKVVWETESLRRTTGPSGGALATAGGLVFAGNGAGQELRAYDAKTGKQLWSFKTQTAIYAAADHL